MPLDLTDTFGNRISRPGRRAILAVLDAPVNMVVDGPDEYALVYCAAVECSLSRSGELESEAVYELSGVDGAIEVHHDRREMLVRLFLAHCRSASDEVERLTAKLSRPHHRQLALW